jgi:flagellar hook-associated protein 3 FlgL
MRITNSMMVSQFLNDANNSLSRVCKYQNQVDSTKRITNISDDPEATTERPQRNGIG